MKVNTITENEIFPIEIEGKEIVITPDNSKRVEFLNKEEINFLIGLLESMTIFTSNEEEDYMLKIIEKLNNLDIIKR